MSAAYPTGQWCPKMLIENLCAQQAHAPDRLIRDEMQYLINVLREHRPIGPDGKHGNRHTSTCGCEDKGE
ncbi:hypothetical protein [Prescottella equi]|uniref:hypothetical protein n=1 Tax=Rhodococcus hoagii TaxID=43767 RepID=UPI001EEBF00D|nr:hypothetical protein [Prescottella equi]